MGKRTYNFTRVTPKKWSKTTTCMQEMHDFLNCLPRNNYDADRCAKQRAALNACVEREGNAGKQKSSINYHLSLICRRAKR
ncbi:hypothetical protein KP509_20G009500 [Ceratopteris richardii]|uniref:IMS import disulfide relay-system CHCH-CHCH-like Cx9C domain-containing protein n=1 Tax=Ceratopteris richardii TaxID=49495 RepID=A0A8T2SEZ5_CERRI|nr:hypothetical protein KP509_20G009500 [Ceratopteris richardii]